MKTKINFKQAILAGVFASGTAAVANSIIYLIFHSAGVLTDDLFVQPNEPLTLVPVIASSILPTLIASIVFYLIEKFTNNGFKIFRIVSLILLVLSFINPFAMIENVTVGYALVLNAMHIVVVAALFYFTGKAVKKQKN